MKVKITKTIDVHQIPKEARRMLDQAKNNLVYGLPESMNQIVMHSLSSQGEVFFQTIDYLDSIRKDLASLDESLQEVQNILVGYREAVMPSQEQPDPDLEREQDQEWLDNEEAGYEKLMSQASDIEEANEVDDEEG
jgi:hypothetical protein